MKKLDGKVNIIPIIAKADTISKVELQKFKVGNYEYIAWRLGLFNLNKEEYFLHFHVLSYYRKK
jgi:septin family protein